MDDTTTQTAVNQPAAEASSQPVSPASEPTTSDAEFEAIVARQNTAPAETSEPVSATAPAVEQPVTPTPTEDVSEHQPRPAQRRIQELLSDNKALREQLLSQQVPVPQTPLPAPKLSELVQGRDYVDPAELDQLGQQLVQQGAQAANGTTALELQQLRNEMKLNQYLNEVDREALSLKEEFPELQNNPDLEAKIVEDFKRQAVRIDPRTNTIKIDDTARLADVAKSNVEFYRRVAESAKSQATANLNEQIDAAALTPTVGSDQAQEKDFDSMSLSEQEAYLRAQGHDI